MSESIISFLVIFSEIGVVLGLIAVGMVIYLIRRKQKDSKLIKSFIETLKQGELGRKDNIMDILQKVHDMDKELADKTAQGMLVCEKKIYSRALKLFMGHDGESLTQLQKDVENMAATYRKLATSAETVNVIERGENPKLTAQLRITIKQLTAERDKLQTDLDEAMKSMDNMLQEYTSMYSGGGAKKEGLKHIENELHQLKDKIQTNLVDVDEGLDLAVGESGDIPGSQSPKSNEGTQ